MNHFSNHHLAGTPPAPNHQTHQPQTNQDWVLTASLVMLLIQTGYALRASGAVRYKNSQSIVLKIMSGAVVGILAWWIVIKSQLLNILNQIGYAFALSNLQHVFIGHQKFFTYGFQAGDFASWTFSAACAIAAANIVVQAGAERFQICAATVIAFFFTIFSYAICAHWNFGKGWLYSLGYHDFAGCGTISLVAGTAGLISTIILKPRQNRFTNPQAFASFSPLFVGLGTLLTLVGWTFLNSGFVAEGDEQQERQGLVVVNTLLGAVGGFITGLSLHCFATKQEGLIAGSNGLLAGVIAVSADCDNIETWTALLFGVIGALFCSILSKQLSNLQIDDPIGVVSVHFGGSLMGLILTGLLDLKNGLFYGHGGSQLGSQLVAIVTQILWTTLTIVFPSLVLKGLGKYRIDENTEAVGLDVAKCGGEAIVFQAEDPKSVQEELKAPSKLAVSYVYK